jgi:hypothetical protein
VLTSSTISSGTGYWPKALLGAIHTELIIVLESGNKVNKYTCPGESVRHLHTSILLDKHIELPGTEIKIRCCSCSYHIVLSCQYLLIPKETMGTFIASLASINLAIDALETLCTLLFNVSCDKNRTLKLNHLEMVNILQAEHGMQVD